MDIRSKKFSHSMITKLMVFIIMIACFTGVIQAIVDLDDMADGDVGMVFEDNYFLSKSFMRESDNLMSDLTRLLKYKNEENILKGETISKEELRNEVQDLYFNFQVDSKSYNPNLSEAENYEKFKVENADKIAQVRDRLIKKDVREFHLLEQNIQEVKDPVYYASDGVNVYSNSMMKEKEPFKTYPSYMVFEGYNQEVYPKEIEANKYLDWVTMQMDEMGSDNNKVYVAFSKDFLHSKINAWKENKGNATKDFYRLLGFLAGFILTFFYLILVNGRKSFKDKEAHLHALDKLYSDLNLLLCAGLIALWVAIVDFVGLPTIIKWVTPITILFSVVFFVLILSLVRHVKNGTLVRHSLIYQIIKGIVLFIRNVYDSGNVGVKTVLIVIGYPLLIAITFFMFPITIGVAAWFALKKVKAFKAIKDGVERIKNGEIHHSIDIDGKGEFASLAANINSITDGLKNAVDNELKSERLKTELITNVSHDIRTPLTSIITYVDLLKKEKDPSKMEEYIAVLDQKSKRLKTLTDDLFDAAKASSGNIPVQIEKIDIVSLITQGLGEVSEKIEEQDLEFRLNNPNDKCYVAADGKLVWRSIENVLSNIFKYALRGSRVYINIEDLGTEILVTFKNISAYELNISADELMERFKRGDESRSSQGSGLGLSIAKSLIDIQQGKFLIQIDGDLFKTMIYLPKHSNE
ncbi:HAMP domain-containing sensor histidine kinase [Neobacillus sp. OS1-2]|uniref:HAMP domain-containing sensor histidine kinase n=1 Tax=Neobacillus sp. OS1-2 TaxID=3070680 RepID=UPI0027DF6568|nr:HAMP domain-containing sensor histidine kinase [Neobacillus sp. OS1-2]WML38243.1 HAMP domain-containing sensor histidine kinase [Neobacillus sp. OS1-2]